MKTEDFYRRYGNMILSIAYRITGNSADAWDILHDTTLEFERRKPQGNIKSWAAKVATNKSLNLVKKNSRKPLPQESHEKPVYESVEEKEVSRAVDKALMELSPIERAVVTLKKYENLSHREIALSLGISEENSRVILTRALKKLKIILSPFLGGVN